MNPMHYFIALCDVLVIGGLLSIFVKELKERRRG